MPPSIDEPQSNDQRPPRIPPRWIVGGLFVLYLAFVIYGSLVPLNFKAMPISEALERFSHINYLDLGVGKRADLLANFLLFIPLTFLAMALIAGVPPRARAALWGLVVAPAAAGFAVAIEFTQVFFPGRTVSLNDITAESIGGLVGVVLWAAAGRRVTHWWTGLWRARAARDRATQILLGYFVAWAIYQWFPFDFMPSPVGIYRHYKHEGRYTLVPFADRDRIEPFQYFTKTASVVPIAWLLVLWRRRAAHPLADAALLTVVLATVAELGQVAVYSRSPSTTDIILACAGALLGILLVAHIGPAARRPVTQRAGWKTFGPIVKWTALVLWIAALAAVAWRPFNFALPEGGVLDAAREAFGRVPLSSHYTMPETLSAAQVLRRFGAFFALGLMARSVTGWARGRGKLAASIAVVLAASCIELGQLFVPERVADLATIVIESVGGIIGVMLLPGVVRIFVEGDEEYSLNTKTRRH